MTMNRSRQRAPLPGDEALASARFHDHQLQCEVVKIMPGELFVASGRIALATVLGSCVSACIWDPVTRIGGMNHFMLAEGRVESGNSESMRYGRFAMDTLIEHVVAAGALRHCLQAKVFGGGQVLRQRLSQNDIGGDNARFVLDYLEEQGIEVVAQDLGDVCPRKLYFFPDTGRVLLRRLPTDASEVVLREEQAYRQRIVHEA